MQALERKLAGERQHREELEDLIQDLRAARFLREDMDLEATATAPLPPLQVNLAQNLQWPSRYNLI